LLRFGRRREAAEEIAPTSGAGDPRLLVAGAKSGLGYSDGAIDARPGFRVFHFVDAEFPGLVPDCGRVRFHVTAKAEQCVSKVLVHFCSPLKYSKPRTCSRQSAHDARWYRCEVVHVVLW